MKRLFLSYLTAFSLDRSKTVIGLAIMLTILFGLQFPRVTISSSLRPFISSRTVSLPIWVQISSEVMRNTTLYYVTVGRDDLRLRQGGYLWLNG